MTEYRKLSRRKNLFFTLAILFSFLAAFGALGVVFVGIDLFSAGSQTDLTPMLQALALFFLILIGASLLKRLCSSQVRALNDKLAAIPHKTRLMQGETLIHLMRSRYRISRLWLLLSLTGPLGYILIPLSADGLIPVPQSLGYALFVLMIPAFFLLMHASRQNGCYKWLKKRRLIPQLQTFSAESESPVIPNSSESALYLGETMFALQSRSCAMAFPYDKVEWLYLEHNTMRLRHGGKISDKTYLIVKLSDGNQFKPDASSSSDLSALCARITAVNPNLLMGFGDAQKQAYQQRIAK